MILIYVISSDQLELYEENCSTKVFGSGFSLEMKLANDYLSLKWWMSLSVGLTKHNKGVISHATILINLLIPLSLAPAFGRGKEDGRLGSKVTEVAKSRNKNDHIAMGSHGHQCVYTGNRSHLLSMSQREGDQCSAAQSAPVVCLMWNGLNSSIIITGPKTFCWWKQT